MVEYPLLFHNCFTYHHLFYSDLQHGKLKDVRIVTYRGGKSKGLAYVEYYDEVSRVGTLFPHYPPSLSFTSHCYT